MEDNFEITKQDGDKWLIKFIIRMSFLHDENGELYFAYEGGEDYGEDEENY